MPWFDVKLIIYLFLCRSAISSRLVIICDLKVLHQSLMQLVFSELRASMSSHSNFWILPLEKGKTLLLACFSSYSFLLSSCFRCWQLNLPLSILFVLSFVLCMYENTEKKRVKKRNWTSLYHKFPILNFFNVFILSRIISNVLNI